MPMPNEDPIINPDDLDPVVAPTEQTVTSKKKKGFNPDQLRKTIVTKIDKDGFHERTVYYGKDSVGSGDWSTAKVKIINNSSYTILARIFAYYSKFNGATANTNFINGHGQYVTLLVPVPTEGGYFIHPQDIGPELDSSSGFSQNFTVSGNAEIDSEYRDIIKITGDCEILYDGSSPVVEG